MRVRPLLPPYCLKNWPKYVITYTRLAQGCRFVSVKTWACRELLRFLLLNDILYIQQGRNLQVLCGHLKRCASVAWPHIGGMGGAAPSVRLCSSFSGDRDSKSMSPGLMESTRAQKAKPFFHDMWKSRREPADRGEARWSNLEQHYLRVLQGQHSPPRTLNVHRKILLFVTMPRAKGQQLLLWR